MYTAFNPATTLSQSAGPSMPSHRIDHMIVAATRAAAAQVTAHYRFGTDGSVRAAPTMLLEAASWDLDVHTSENETHEGDANFGTAEDDQHDFDSYVHQWGTHNQDPSETRSIALNREWHPENVSRDQ